MSEDLYAELTNMMGPIQWEYLKPHVQRDAVVVVNGNLNLAEVGVAIATNNTQAVERWISEQLIMKPTAEELTLWNRENKQFTSIIVQPYVLIQDKPYAPEEDKPSEPLAESSIESSTEPSTEPSTEKEE
ncbi:MAG: DUF2288 domain-containing protein [Phormidesmis sp.]